MLQQAKVSKSSFHRISYALVVVLFVFVFARLLFLASVLVQTDSISLGFSPRTPPPPRQPAPALEDPGWQKLPSLQEAREEALWELKGRKGPAPIAQTHTLVDDPTPSTWLHLDWVANKTLVKEFQLLQRRFLDSPDPLAFRPQPLIYRPILHSMGWGNMLHDISHTLILAHLLGRPFLMSFQVKEPTGALEKLLPPNLVDWTFSPRLQTVYSLQNMSRQIEGEHHFQLSCRPTHKK